MTSWYPIMSSNFETVLPGPPRTRCSDSRGKGARIEAYRSEPVISTGMSFVGSPSQPICFLRVRKPFQDYSRYRHPYIIQGKYSIPGGWWRVKTHLSDLIELLRGRERFSGMWNPMIIDRCFISDQYMHLHFS